MNPVQSVNEIAYACIFTESVEDAANHLTHLIMNRASGVEEAVGVWRDALAGLLHTPENLHQLNRFGASYSIAEWREILTRVSRSLRTGPEREG